MALSFSDKAFGFVAYSDEDCIYQAGDFFPPPEIMSDDSTFGVCRHVTVLGNLINLFTLHSFGMMVPCCLKGS